MRLIAKIRKLFSPDAFARLSEYAARAVHPVDANRILDSIDRDEIARISQIYPRRADARGINAWDDAAHWIKINIKRAQDLWLDRTPPLRILDLGCGAGYFLYVCKSFGHRGIGIDIGDDPFFGAMVAHFGIQRIIARIEPDIPLPDLGQRFDLITAHRICFNRIEREANGEWKEWLPANWKFFLNEIRARFLKPRGRLFLEFNPRADGSLFSPELRELFLREGARIFRSKVLFAADPAQYPRFKQIK